MPFPSGRQHSCETLVASCCEGYPSRRLTPVAMSATAEGTTSAAEVRALIQTLQNELKMLEGGQRTQEARKAAQKDARPQIRTPRFWFVSADKIRNTDELVLPRMQELRGREGWLQLLEISWDAGCSGMYLEAYLSISHRWEEPGAPDTRGVQLQAVKAYLLEHPEIRYVWYDFWSMPQRVSAEHDDRSSEELEQFGEMLDQVNLLYIGLRVLVLMDISYMSRFWTQLEAYLSMQTPHAVGLRPSSASMQRWTVVPIHNATAELRTEMVKMWAMKTTEEAYNALGAPDVTVTNSSDKVKQLKKLQHLDATVILSMTLAEVVRRAAAAGVVRWPHVRLQVRGNGGSGKTSTVQAMSGQPFDSASKSTVGTDMAEMELCGRKEGAAEDLRLRAFDSTTEEQYAHALAAHAAELSAELSDAPGSSIDSMIDVIQAMGDVQPLNRGATGPPLPSEQPPSEQPPTAMTAPLAPKVPVELVIAYRDGKLQNNPIVQVQDLGGQPIFRSIIDMLTTSTGTVYECAKD